MKITRDSLVDFFIWLVIAVCAAIFGFALLILALSFIAEPAHAQIGGEMYSARDVARPHGRFIVAWNATGSTINDGTLVMADTTGATSQPQVAIGKGFKTWDGVPANARRILGVLVGNTPGYAQGRILVDGFHPWVKMDATAITGWTVLRPSFTTIGAMAAWVAADSAATNRFPTGSFQRYANTDSLRGYVMVKMDGRR